MVTVVVGAGIIGTAIAHDLQKRGRQVVLVDREAPGMGASFGNMASIAVTEFMPASRPQVWKQIPGWMLDPEGPVRVRPGYMPRLVPWFLRFIAAARPSKLRALEAQGAALCARSLDDTLALLAETGLSDQISAEGCLSLYTDEAEYRADRDHIEILERFGFAHTRLTGDQARELEPELSRTIGLAVLFPQNRSMKDPYKLVLALAERFTAMGGRIERGEVVGFTRGDAIREVVLKDGRRLPADEVVVAAGAFSHQLSKLLGEPIPLETERGYHTQIMSPGISMRHSIIWPARAFMVTPTAGGIRVGGTVEMAGLEAAPDYRRAKVTVKRAMTALPNLKADNTSEWMGHRPALPDTVPILSASAKTRGVYYATGHGHLGLTYAATTARLMGELVTGASLRSICTPTGSTGFKEQKMTQKVCLVTGGGRGIGGAVAREMAARGYKVALMSPSESCETLAAELGGVARRGVAQSDADLKGIVDTAMQAYGRIDAVLNHTGHPPKGDLLAITDENWDLANDMIIKSVVRMARLVTPIMQAQGGGSIVNITTYAAFEPSLWFPASCVYRAGVSAFAKLYADRYGPENIRMNCLMPGFTDSLDVAKYGELAALKRIGRVEEQAKAAAFLLTDDSSYVTGQSLRVDGGVTKHI